MVLATGQCPKGLFGFNDPQNHTALTTSKVFGLRQRGCTEDEPGIVGNDYYSCCGSELSFLLLLTLDLQSNKLFWNLMALLCFSLHP